MSGEHLALPERINIFPLSLTSENRRGRRPRWFSRVKKRKKVTHQTGHLAEWTCTWRRARIGFHRHIWMHDRRLAHCDIDIVHNAQICKFCRFGAGKNSRNLTDFEISDIYTIFNQLSQSPWKWQNFKIKWILYSRKFATRYKKTKDLNPQMNNFRNNTMYDEFCQLLSLIIIRNAMKLKNGWSLRILEGRLNTVQ